MLQILYIYPHYTMFYPLNMVYSIQHILRSIYVQHLLPAILNTSTLILLYYILRIQGMSLSMTTTLDALQSLSYITQKNEIHMCMAKKTMRITINRLIFMRE